MLDVHVLWIPERTETTFLRCLATVSEAMAVAKFPVALHVIRGFDGNIGKGRQLGYAQGDYPYVTSVDDDDWIEPEAFLCLEKAMRSNVPAIYTHSTTWQNAKSVVSAVRQNLRVFRRDVAMSCDLSNWPTLDSVPMIHHADSYGDPVIIEKPVYHYNLDEHSASRRLITPELHAKAVALRKKCHG